MKTMENRLIEALMLTDEDKTELLQTMSDLLNYDMTLQLTADSLQQIQQDHADEDLARTNKMTLFLYLWRNGYLLGYQQALNDLMKLQQEGLDTYTAANVKKQLDDHRQIEAENARKQQEWKQ